MKKWIFIFVLFLLKIHNAQNDTIKIKIWDQFAFLPDSGVYNVFLGGPGYISKSLLYQASILKLADGPFFMNSQPDLPEIRTTIPLVDAQYILGDELEQNLALYHSQPISLRSDYAISFLKRSHDGYFLRQQTNANYFQTRFTNYSKSDKYCISLGIKHHRQYLDLNGGLTDDSTFINQSDLINRKLLNVNMDHSYSNDKLWQFNIQQSRKFNRNKLDTNQSGDIFNKISWMSSYSWSLKNYYDSLVSNDFTYNYFDTVRSCDSLLKNKWSNNLSIEFNRNTDSSIRHFSVNLNTTAISHYNHLLDTLIMNHSFSFDYYKSINNKKFKAFASYYPIGFRKENFDILFQFDKVISDLVLLNTKMEINRITPALEISTYYSNHFTWNNTKDPLLYFCLSGGIQVGSINLSSNYSETYDPIYFDLLGHPVQYQGNAQVIQSAISHYLKKKNFKLTSEIIYQYQGGAQIYQLPEWIGSVKINYIIKPKNDGFLIDLGMNNRFFSEYALMDYKVPTNVFAVNQDRMQPNYFYTDLTAKAQIKSVTIYAMLTHLNAGFLGYNYFAALHYPSIDRYFKFGLKWLFLN